MKFSQKYIGVLTAILMSFFMATIMSLVMAMVNVGFTSVLLAAFLRSWVIALFVAIPTGLLLTPIIKRIVATITE